MNKIGLIYDSTCGITKLEAHQKGLGFVPLVINIDDKQYFAGDTITSDMLYSMMTKETKISTSTPIAEMVVNAFREALRHHEKVVFITMSKKFSGTINQAKMIIDAHPEFQGKVFVYDGLWSSPWTYLYLEEVISKVKHSHTVEEVFAYLDSLQKYMVGFLAPSSIYWFYKGGRISKKQYVLGSLFKIIPILTVKDGEINPDSIERARSADKAIDKIIEMITPLVEQIRSEGKEYQFASLYAGDSEITEKVAQAAAKAFNVDIKTIIKMPLSPEQTAHMGPKAFGLSLKVK